MCCVRLSTMCMVADRFGVETLEEASLHQHQRCSENFYPVASSRTPCYCMYPTPSLQESGEASGLPSANKGHASTLLPKNQYCLSAIGWRRGSLLISSPFRYTLHKSGSGHVSSCCSTRGVPGHRQCAPVPFYWKPFICSEFILCSIRLV